jgi:hypothetical protein
MSPVAPQAEVLLAIEEAKRELTKLLNDGIAGIQLAIGHLQREHDRALLEQAKLNATFANRDELAALTRRADGHESRLSDIRHVMDDSMRDRKEIRASLETLTQSTASGRTHALQQQLNWLVSGIVAVMAALAGYAGAHFVH